MSNSSFSRLWLVIGGGVLFLCLAVLVGIYTFPTPLLGSVADEDIEKEVGLQNASAVSAQDQVSPGAADFGGVRPRKVTIDLDPFDLNVPKSMGSGGLASRGPLSGDLRMEVSEKEIARIARSTSEGNSIETVELEENRVTVESETSILGFDVPVAVQGGLEIVNQELVFEPRRVTAFGIRLPKGMADELLSESDFSYPLEDLPYKASISKVEVKKDYLVLLGRLESIPLGAQDG